MIVIIACGFKKRDVPSKARDMYTGAYFKSALGAALRTATPDRIFILSGKYGLLPLDKVIDPYEQKMGEAGSITSAAVIHSHPNGPQWPSADDMADQLACGVPYGIVPCHEDRAGKVFFFGDGVPRDPILGRGFRHGVTDCYALIRDWYLIERGMTLPEVPRAWGWWNKKKGPGLDLYLDTYHAAGFRTQGRHAKLQRGDIILIQSAESPVVNHAGIYIDDGGDFLLHHTCTVGYDPSKVSEREPVSRHGQFVRDVIRYAGASA